MGKKIKPSRLEEEYKETRFDMTKEEKEWFDKFNKEWIYGPDYTDGECSIKDPEFKKEAHRNKNMRNRDAYSLSEKMGMLSNLTPEEREFMEEASDAWEWQSVYKFHGFEAAMEAIFDQAVRDIDDGQIESRIVLSRFLIKMIELRKQNKKEPRVKE